jgi:hypothetical protein
MDLQLLQSEMKSVGLTVDVDSNGNFSGMDKDHTLVLLVFKAFGLPLISDECVSLMKELGEESKEWLAYLEARKAPIAAIRAQKYKDNADSIIFKALETSDKIIINSIFYEIKVSKADMDAWIAKKEEIRKEYPYPK